MRRMTAPAAPNVRRRRGRISRLFAGIRIGVLVAAIGATVIAPVWLVRDGTLAAWTDDLTASAIAWSAGFGLKVENVLVTGRAKTDGAEILAALAIRRDAPILAFDPAAARDRIEALPWVRRAAIERRLPGTISVAIEEREPLAVWQHEGRILLIDRDGVAIDAAPDADYRVLPVLVGPDVPDHATRLIAMLDAEPALAARVVAAIRVGGRRWTLEIDNGIRISLPEQDPGSAWHRLAGLVRDHDLFARDIVAIDLRLPDRLVIRRAPDAPPLIPNTTPGKET